MYIATIELIELTAILLIGPVAALVPMVALLVLLNTFLAISALEL